MEFANFPRRLILPTTKTGTSSSVVASDDYVRINPSGDHVCALFTPVGNKGKTIDFEYLSNSAVIYQVTFTTPSGTINDGITDAASIASAGDKIGFISDGTNWIVYKREIMGKENSFNPTFSNFGSVSLRQFRSNRRGRYLEVNGFFTMGTPSASAALISIGFNGSNANTGLDIDTATLGGSGAMIFGEWSNTSAANKSGRIIYINQLGVFGFGDLYANNANSILNATSVGSNTNVIMVNLWSIPITKWRDT